MKSYVQKFDNLDEIGQFLEKHKGLQHTQGERNSLMYVKEIN